MTAAAFCDRVFPWKRRGSPQAALGWASPLPSPPPLPWTSDHTPPRLCPAQLLCGLQAPGRSHSLHTEGFFSSTLPGWQQTDRGSQAGPASCRIRGKGIGGGCSIRPAPAQGPYPHETAYAPAGCCRIGTGSRRRHTCRALWGERERPFEGPHKPQRLLGRWGPLGSWAPCPRGSPSLASEGEAGEEGATHRGRRPVTGRRVQPRGIYRGLTVCQAPSGRWGRRRAERIFSAPQPTSLSLGWWRHTVGSVCWADDWMKLWTSQRQDERRGGKGRGGGKGRENRGGNSEEPEKQGWGGRGAEGTEGWELRERIQTGARVQGLLAFHRRVPGTWMREEERRAKTRKEKSRMVAEVGLGSGVLRPAPWAGRGGPVPAGLGAEAGCSHSSTHLGWASPCLHQRPGLPGRRPEHVAGWVHSLPCLALSSPPPGGTLTYSVGEGKDWKSGDLQFLQKRNSLAKSLPVLVLGADWLDFCSWAAASQMGSQRRGRRVSGVGLGMGRWDQPGPSFQDTLSSHTASPQNTMRKYPHVAACFRTGTWDGFSVRAPRVDTFDTKHQGSQGSTVLSLHVSPSSPLSAGSSPLSWYRQVSLTGSGQQSGADGLPRGILAPPLTS